MHDLNEKKRKVARSAIRDVKHEQLRREVEENPEGIRYGLNMNTFFPYIRETTMLATQNIKLAQARMFGQPLIFDLDYDDWMDGREQTNTAMQIRDAHAYNKDARDPFWYQVLNKSAFMFHSLTLISVVYRFVMPVLRVQRCSR